VEIGGHAVLNDICEHAQLMPSAKKLITTVIIFSPRSAMNDSV
jgi:hypothetical protein